METKIISSISKAVDDLIQNSTSDRKLTSILQKHKRKIHFVPIKYRILGGILQSMNIQFGNFLENTITNIVSLKDGNEIIEELSGKKFNNFKLSKKTAKLIDNYIISCQIEQYTDAELENKYDELLEQIVEYENTETETEIFKQDIDLLFMQDNKKYVYVEIKYNDDHDTGKFIDINRKFLKTFALLVRKLNIKNKEDLQPVLMYFNNKKMKGNIYLPESVAIYRGEHFFSNFTDVLYSDIDNCFKNISTNRDLNKKFDDLYNKIMEL